MWLCEDFYVILHQFTIDTLLNPEYRTEFEAYLSKSVLKYIRDAKMEDDITWGTDVKIYAIATALDTSIPVYYKPPQASKYSWHFYKPLIQHANNVKLKETKEHDQIIYLQNTDVHYNRVVNVH